MSSQDALEEELLLTTMRTHLKFAGSTCAEGMRRVAATLSLISTSSPPLLTTVTTALLLLLLACGACAVLAMSERLARRALGVQESGGFNSASSEKRCVLAHWDGEKVAVHGIRGRRPAMEDRFVSVTVEVAGNKKIWINAVLDGHGGEFSATYIRHHLTQSLIRKIQTLHSVTSKVLTPSERLEAYIAQAPDPNKISKAMLAIIRISEEEYKQIRPGGEIEDVANSSVRGTMRRFNLISNKNESLSIGKADDHSGRKMKPEGPILSSRVKSLEELPTLGNKISAEDGESIIESVLSLNKYSHTLRRKVSSSASGTRGGAYTSGAKPRKNVDQEHQDLADFISPSTGDILYSKLLKQAIAEADRALLEECKKAGQLGGTTLILSVIDSGVLWVANVGDSRGVLAVKGSKTSKLLSYDHKPSQLKERRRIEDAGGYVSLNGVWRLQGVLAVSRALGDSPLKDKALLTCEPDVLSFSGVYGSLDLAVLATDGLWDVFSNDEALAVARRHKATSGSDWPRAAASELANAAYDRDSADNVTVMVLDLEKFME